MRETKKMKRPKITKHETALDSTNQEEMSILYICTSQFSTIRNTNIASAKHCKVYSVEDRISK